MKKILIALSATALAIGLMGCMSVPKTKIKFDPSSGVLAIQSPKNVSIESIEVVKDGTKLSITAKGYTSTNDSQAIAIVAQANAATAAALAAAGQDALKQVITAAK